MQLLIAIPVLVLNMQHCPQWPNTLRDIKGIAALVWMPFKIKFLQPCSTVCTILCTYVLTNTPQFKGLVEFS